MATPQQIKTILERLEIDNPHPVSTEAADFIRELVKTHSEEIQKAEEREKLYLAQVRHLQFLVDEIEEKLATIRSGVVDLPHEKLVQTITSVGPEEYKQGHWLTNKMRPLERRAAEAEMALGKVKDILRHPDDYTDSGDRAIKRVFESYEAQAPDGWKDYLVYLEERRRK